MTELLKNPDDDPIAQLEIMLREDIDFTRTISIVSNDITNLAELYRLRKRYGQGSNENRAFYVSPLMNEVTAIHSRFVELCARYRVDPNRPDDTNKALFAMIEDELALEVYNMNKKIKFGDTIAVSSALVVDLRDDGDEPGIFTVNADHKLTGTFVRPVVGPLPDDAYVFNDDDDALAPIGVGLCLSDLILVDETGESHHNECGKYVVVALGTIGLLVEKLHFQDDPEH
ncbi:hypothetical protein EOL96_00335 [Candidatus Saccharibacteria bacterium]|nr:hypothetical protein [Candidatus Saccharibacteria bacterium]